MSAYVKTAAPHISKPRSVSGIYWGQVLCLAPIAVAGLLLGGGNAFRVLLVSLAAAFAAESFAKLVFVSRKILFRRGWLIMKSALKIG